MTYTGELTKRAAAETNEARRKRRHQARGVGKEDFQEMTVHHNEVMNS